MKDANASNNQSQPPPYRPLGPPTPPQTKRTVVQVHPMRHYTAPPPPTSESPPPVPPKPRRDPPPLVPAKPKRGMVPLPGVNLSGVPPVGQYQAQQNLTDWKQGNGKELFGNVPSKDFYVRGEFIQDYGYDRAPGTGAPEQREGREGAPVAYRMSQNSVELARNWEAVQSRVLEQRQLKSVSMTNLVQGEW